MDTDDYDHGFDQKPHYQSVRDAAQANTAAFVTGLEIGLREGAAYAPKIGESRWKIVDAIIGAALQQEDIQLLVDEAKHSLRFGESPAVIIGITEGVEYTLSYKR